MTSEFRILHVCTGNIGRSPVAERLMEYHVQRWLGEDTFPFRNASAGTSGCTGRTMEPFSRTALERRGIAAGGFVARQLTDTMVEEADLVLTATRLHRATVVGLVPAAVRRTFTLREFGQLADVAQQVAPPPSGDRVIDAGTRVAVAGRLRAAAYPVAEAEELDVADPIGASLSFYLDRAAEIDLACKRGVDLLLAGVRAGRPQP